MVLLVVLKLFYPTPGMSKGFGLLGLIGLCQRFQWGHGVTPEVPLGL